MPTDKQANRLINEKSPYLLQHAYNPVDWFPWSDEAFEKARREDKPIFLSIGYSACHWCHVMEEESFEDEEVAAFLNKNFVSIKVDREERPDIDHVYMTVCQLMTGSGGWPLTVLMTPDKKPFFSGTYFLKRGRMGMPGLMEILEQTLELWKNNRENLLQVAESITDAIREAQSGIRQARPGLQVQHQSQLPLRSAFRSSIFQKAFRQLRESFDSEFGGFGGAPKFPMPHKILFLLRYFYIARDNEALSIAQKTLESMYRGGIFDHIGYGFSRYSTDRKWLVPHFEKMLYDNALLAIAYTEAWKVTGRQLYREIAENILDYVLSRMTAPEGGFYTAEDADSEGEEGKYYLFTPEEIRKVLGDTGEEFCRTYDITEKGNFEGKNIPNLLKYSGEPDEPGERFREEIEKLGRYREERMPLFKDDKILTSWNGMMIAAMAYAASAFECDRYRAAAEKAVEFIRDKLTLGGKLMARYRDGEANYPGYLDDYAYYIWGLTELYETTLKTEYLEQAVQLCQAMLDLFLDREEGNLYLTRADSEELLFRPREAYDGAVPSGHSVAVFNLLRLAAMTGREEWKDIACRLIENTREEAEQYLSGHMFLLCAWMFYENSTQVVVSGKADEQETRDMIDAIRKKYHPFVTLVYKPDGVEGEKMENWCPSVIEKDRQKEKAVAFVCSQNACRPPVTSKEQLEELLVH